jgi:hypothetical protein
VTSYRISLLIRGHEGSGGGRGKEAAVEEGKRGSSEVGKEAAAGQTRGCVGGELGIGGVQVASKLGRGMWFYLTMEGLFGLEKKKSMLWRRDKDVPGDKDGWVQQNSHFLLMRVK